MHALTYRALSFLLSFIFLSQVICTSDFSGRRCRCLPGDACWPSVREWNALNRTIKGRLLRLRPVGSVCHGAEYDEDACDAVRAGSGSALWRIAQPGALVANNWETPGTDEMCLINAPRETPCNQGRTPHYAVMAESVQDIQVAVRFARRHNLHVVIRNTGHDGAGRSSGPGSLQINTSRLKQIQFHDEFVPSGGRHALGSAVTAGSGFLGVELLEAARTRGLNVVSGVCSSVGVTGGFLLGGGVGLLSPLHGLGSDNALQFRVVTADGDLIVANHIQNPDLFWALRGGGGGTFGVVVEATIRTFPEVPAILFTLSANLSGDTAHRSIWAIARELVTLLPDLKRRDEATSAILATGLAVDGANLLARILFPTRTEKDLAETHAQFNDFFEALDDLDLPLEGNYGRLEGSVLISDELFFAPNGTSTISNLVADLEYVPGESMEILVASDSTLQITLRRYLPPPSTAKTFANSPLPRLRALESPSLGSYLNTGDPEEPGFQEAFWGGNYEKLLRAKRKWDSDSLFIVHLGVGSEGWDEEGICWGKDP
ncbi:hypothetical protein BJX62DRAFT_250543 [Aspergillus germanicus]